jgi:ketosteroid isomerase-like protein
MPGSLEERTGMTPKAMALSLALMLVALRPASAADDAAQAQIRSALTQWTADFNGAKAEKACALFEPGVIADIRTEPEQNYSIICDRLKQVLSDRTRAFSYASDIKEILVFGDVAVVRLDWTLTVTGKDGAKTKSIESGMDLFRRQADGSWKIMRYMAYTQ